jgi:hypothetical protein
MAPARSSIPAGPALTVGEGALPPHPVMLTVLAPGDSVELKAYVTFDRPPPTAPDLAALKAARARNRTLECHIRRQRRGRVMPRSPMAERGPRRMDISEETAKQYVGRVRDKYARAGRAAATKTELYYRAVEDGHLPPYPTPRIPPSRL